MEEIYYVMVAILALLAVSGLYVGVTNDAVNFLNSALGSKAASFKTILIVASIGIIIGAVTSSGMMDVARHGMFHPELFTFKEVMLLYVGVMFANVILLDLYNSLGLPTSTTVSLIFCLLGSAVAVSLFKIATDDAISFSQLGDYINTAKAMGIVSGILLSVVLAFTMGTLVMWISRLIFSFRYMTMLRRLGAVWCGMSLTSILYFALFKGLKSQLAGTLFVEWVNEHLLLTLVATWVVCSLVLFFLQLFRVNILRITILAGTFSLALAFAGNDLVNFIGVPIAGLEAFTVSQGNENMLMEALAQPSSGASNNIIYIVISGVIMVITLWTSRKAMNVSQTELSLSSADGGGEQQFSSSLFSRAVVRAAVNTSHFFDKITPAPVKNFVSKRFEWADIEHSGAPYDMIRSTVNLTTASLLIAFGTSLKLPLSTTYVCFMVAMGSSLADKAWGRESAVYRITGVITVVMGWFVTGFGGFIIAFALGLLLMWGDVWAFGAITILCVYMFIHSNFIPKKKKDEKKKSDAVVRENLVDNTMTAVSETIKSSTRIYNRTIVALMKENRKALKELSAEASEMYEENRRLKYSIATTLRTTYSNDLNLSLYYVQILDYLNEMTKSLVHITRPSYEHIDNNHTGLSHLQSDELMSINADVNEIYSRIIYMFTSNDFSTIDEVLIMRDKLFERLAQATKDELARITAGESNSRAGMLFLGIISETKTMVLQSRNLIKSRRYFIEQEGKVIRQSRIYE
ncbi:MAG: inorganic phosphate transporter [Rikenellaceae bacterium]|nr:inorganic phosphate transporter [Rikenellaceae bacterium]